MAHLTCTLHKRRVMVLPDSANTIHRSVSDGYAKCDSPTVTIDGETFTPKAISEWNKKETPEDRLERELWFGTSENPIL